MVLDADLDDARRGRFARHLSLEGFGEDGQRALLAAHVLVVGAGGLGSPVITHLAAAGVGHLTLVDDDVVETSNLPRQVIHTEASVGASKVVSAKGAVARRAASARVDVREERLDVAQAVALVAEVDVVVDCTDSAQARYLLNDACVLLGVPFVWASIAQFAGQFAVVDPGRSACYRCVFPDVAASRGALTCEAGGVLGALPGVMGTMQAVEVMKILAGVGAPARDGVRFYDALTATMTTLPVARDRACLACGRGEFFAGVEDEGTQEVPGQALRDAARVVIDVREGWEVEQEPMPPWVAGRVLPRPWGDGWSQDVVASVAAEVVDHDVTVVCAHGVRSAAAAALLRAAGVRAVSVRGGRAQLDGDGRA